MPEIPLIRLLEKVYLKTFHKSQLARLSRRGSSIEAG
jgi:hypothetical protein